MSSSKNDARAKSACLRRFYDSTPRESVNETKDRPMEFTLLAEKTNALAKMTLIAKKYKVDIEKFSLIALSSRAIS
jgi:hypothetical protein